VHNISKNTETMISEHRHIKVYHFNIKLSKGRHVTSRCLGKLLLWDNNWTGHFSLHYFNAVIFLVFIHLPLNINYSSAGLSVYVIHYLLYNAIGAHSSSLAFLFVQHCSSECIIPAKFLCSSIYLNHFLCTTDTRSKYLPDYPFLFHFGWQTLANSNHD